MNNITVIGAGVMGSGITQVFAVNGYCVSLCDLNAEALEKSRQRIEESRFGLNKAVELGKMTAQQRDQAVANIHYLTDLPTACREADLAIEVVPEDLELKMKIFKLLDKHTPAHAILASNTAGLPITALAYATNRPEQVIGWHWAQPCIVIKMAEIIKTPATDAAVVETVVNMATSCNKNPVVINDKPDKWGFVGNRLMLAMREEAQKVVDEGVADRAQVDQIMKDCYRWNTGIFELWYGKEYQ